MRECQSPSAPLLMLPLVLHTPAFPSYYKHWLYGYFYLILSGISFLWRSPCNASGCGSSAACLQSLYAVGRNHHRFNIIHYYFVRKLPVFTTNANSLNLITEIVSVRNYLHR